MNLVSIPVALMAAVCFYVGLYYVLFFLRRRGEMENLLFACTCFSIALYDGFCVGLYNASSFADGMFWQRLQFASLALFSTAVSWFIYHFARSKSRKPFVIISIWFSILFLLGLAVHNEWTLSLSRPRPKHITLGDFVNITYHEVDPGVIYGIQYASMILVALYVLFVMIRNYREDNRSHSRPILVSLLIFFVASLNDALVGMGVYPFIYLLEYTYMFIILSMAYVLLNRFVDLHHEVEELNVRLEEKANERGMELLFRDIGTRLYMEMLHDLQGTKKEGADAASLRRLIDYGDGSSPAALSRDVSIISNADELLARVIAKAAEISGAERGYLLLLGDGGGLEPAAFFNTQKGEIAADIEERALRAFSGKTEISGLRAVAAGNEPSMAHLLCVPVMTGEIAIGACCLEKGAPAGPFVENDSRLLSAFMRQVAPTIENAVVYRKAMGAGAVRKRSSLTPRIEEKVKRAVAYIEENYTSEISRENLAASLNMHPDTLGRYFRIYTDRKISEYINELRVHDAARRLKEKPDANVIDIAFAAGFESMATFSRAFIKVMRCTPTDYREKRK